MIQNHHKYFKVVLIFVGLFIFQGCSTEKTGWAHRSYHSMLTRFNGYFNALEIMKESEIAIDKALPDDYTKILPVYKELAEDQTEIVSQDMDVVLEKCARVIRKNSIKKRGKEYTKWIDDCFFLMGKAYYYVKDDSKSFQMLNQAAKKFKDQESRFDAWVWLARLYSRQENYDKALKILSQLESDKTLPERLRLDISKLYTQIYLAEGNIDLAIDELRTAISFAKKKPERLRLTYLLGQLLKEHGERHESMLVFKQVLKMHPEYKMEFYTRIQMAMAYTVETGGAEEVRKVLIKMLKDEKYIEFQDQIYYALAEMDYSEGEVEGTIDYLLLSTEVSEGNDNQKAKSFLKLGEIYFKQPEYQKAQASYDSCVSYMPDDFPNAEEIKNLSNNLKDLVAQIIIIETEDSLQMVAQMDPAERNDLIVDLIQKRIDEEQRKKEDAALQAEAAADVLANGGGISSPGGGPGGIGGPALGAASKWYFYNPTTRNAGESEFKRLWGNRKNEDNWRRSSKEHAFDDDEEAFNQDSEDEYIVNADGDSVKVTEPWRYPNYYLKDLPITKEQVAASNERIVEAYYNLSIIYKNQMDDVPMAIETLVELNNRFNPNAHTADSYYRLYRMYDDQDEQKLSNYYKNKILTEFPDSQYAKIIRDPDFLERENEDLIAATKLYEKAYLKYFQRGYYQQTVEACDQILLHYSQTEIKPKAMFLRAMAIGNTQGEEAYKKELEKIVAEFGKDEYGVRAQELLDGLNIKVLEAQAKAAQEAKEKEKANQAAQMKYVYEPNSMHNFVILVKASGRKLSAVKSAINDFNRGNYKMEGLKMSAVVYQRGYQMITVKSFKSAKQAKNYQTAFENNSSLTTIITENPNYFIVSYTNYALFFKAKDHENYKVWADVKYSEL